MQTVNIPAKWVIPFAQGDSGKVEVPATTTDPTRASLLLGFPPLTMQPPEAGGVPPQGEDFNGAMNQVARITWWRMAGGQFPYDATFASDSNINGYPQGAVVASVDLRGAWISTAENNTVDPDNVGTGWVPGYSYGALALTGQTGGTVTLTPAQAMKRVITVAGTLTSNLTIVVPAWTYDWSVTNATTGAFTVTVKPAAGAGILIPQNGLPAAVRGDGTNVLSLNAAGRLLNVQTFTATGTYTPTAGTQSIVVEVIGAGGGSGGAASTASGQTSMGSGGGGGAYAKSRITTGFSGVTVTVGTGGAGAAAGNNPGSAGGSSSFGSGIIAPGGTAGLGGASLSPGAMTYGGVASGIPTGGNIVSSQGSGGGYGMSFVGSSVGGCGGASGAGGAGPMYHNTTTFNGVPGFSPGSGASGAASPFSSVAHAGAKGADGLVIVWEYA